jgi:hypothetical protein
LKYTVVVPLIRFNAFFNELVRSVDRSDVEIIALPDGPESFPEFAGREILVVPTGKVPPGRKRDTGAAIARGEFLIFFDDDSYPIETYFQTLDELSGSVDAVGGPGLTPLRDGYQALVSGAFFENASFPYVERYAPVGESRPVSEWPSVNFVVRKTVFDRVNGFGTDLWPGEDSHLCRKLTNAGVTIWYEPRLLVMHHRRSSLVSHFRQVFRYGKMRGFLLRESSPTVFFVSLLVAAMLASFGSYASFAWPTEAAAAFFMVLFYVFTRSSRRFSIGVNLVGCIVTPASYAAYLLGFFFSSVVSVPTTRLGR